MLAFVKSILKMLLVPVLFAGGFITMLVTALKDAKWGLFLLIFIIPQPNVWYKFHEYPLGKDFVDLLLASVFLGILIQRRGFALTRSSFVIIIFILTSYLSLFQGAFHFSLPLPVSRDNAFLADWKNYAEMIFLYFLARNALSKEEDQKTAVLIMSAVVFLISIRSYRNFSGGDAFNYDKRVGGPFEAVGLGPNHLGAFIADYAPVALALAITEWKGLKKYFGISTYTLSLHPLLFSYSRGAYLAALSAFGMFGLLKKRVFLVVIVALVISWQTLLPVSVIDRIQMTETDQGGLEVSASHRLDLWDRAIELFYENPVFGIGFNCFGLTVPEGELTDTHNFYMKTLAEQGVVGISVLAAVLLSALASGVRLFRKGAYPFQRGLGLGFIGTVFAMIVTNIFGDRWSYFVLGGYFWILWGIVDSAEIKIPDKKKSGGRP